MTDGETDESLSKQWYWDRRTNTALYPYRTDDGAVRFVTAWHRDEVADARATDTLVPMSEMRMGHLPSFSDLADSFRTAPEADLPALEGRDE